MQFNVIVYNPIGRVMSHDVRVPLTNNHVLVYDDKWEIIPAQVSLILLLVLFVMLMNLAV